MAHVVTKKERRGLALPALRTAGGYFASKNRYDTAFGDIVRTLMTPIGSVPGKRNFGCALHRLVMEPGMLQRKPLVNYVCSDALQKWCPHIILHDLRITVVTARKTLQIKVVFRLVDDSSPVEMMTEIPIDSVKVVSLAGS